MKKFYWFGDSWVVGDELELTVPLQDRHLYVFPTLISQHFSAECINLGVSGSGPDEIPYRFFNIVDQATADDIVFFCLSAPHRTGLLDENDEMLQISPSKNGSANVHPHVQEWYKYFDNPRQRIYNYDRTVNLLYLWATQLGIKAYFLNLFTALEDSVMDIVPASSWLVPRNRCIAQFMLNNIDNDGGLVITDDVPILTDIDWQKQKATLEKYIRPGYAHPNVEGHIYISKKLIGLIEGNL
jgi:hypothetical protein